MPNNSFELLQGSITEVQKQYEILSDIVISNNVKFMVRRGIETEEPNYLTYWFTMWFQKVRETK